MISQPDPNLTYKKETTMMHRNKVLAIFWIGALLIIMGCATAPKVERMESDTTVDVSGYWNDTDSRLVAEEMIADCLGRPWLEVYMSQNNRKMPAVIVGSVKNRTDEHINVRTFVKNLERALINSGRVQFVASKTERGQIRDEREDMAEHATDDTMKGPGKEHGADFMLIGSINSINDEIKGRRVIYYQTNLELISLANNVKAWIGEKQIKKLVKKPKAGW
jgi:uncharacterized protein (TIGR02722 family)